MKKLTRAASLRVKFCAVCICFLSSLPSVGSTRPFDWQYNYISTPFAVFYNPSLIGNNAGYALGVDGRYLDRGDYDGRFALVLPVGDAAKRDGKRDGNGYDYLASPFVSGRNAVSVGGMYASGDNYFLTTGFTTPMYAKYSIRGGASVDFAYNPDKSPAVSLNAAVGAPVVESNVATLTVHNFFASGGNYENHFGVSTGAAGMLYSNPYLFLIPYDLQYSFYFDGGKVSRTEGVARLTFDLTPLLAGRDRTGQAVTASGGYGFVNYAGGDSEAKIYAALGVVFVNRASSASVWGGYGRAEGNYGALMYNSFRESSRSLFATDAFSAALRHGETDSGQILFTLSCRGTNVESWVLRIEGLGGRTVKTFSGGNVVPATILWDRLDSEGNALKENEPVHARLVVKRRNGAVVESNRESIGVEARD